MPMYEYKCKDCQKTFTVALSLSDHGHGKIQCPDCGKKETEQVFSSFVAKTDSKS